MNLNILQRSSSSLQKATTSPDGLAEELSAHLGQKREQGAVVQKIKAQHVSNPYVQRFEDLNVRMSKLTPHTEMSVTQEDLLTFAHCILLARESIGCLPLDSFSEAYIIGRADVFIKKLLSQEKSYTSNKAGLDQLINKIHSFVGSLLTGQSSDELRRKIESETKKASHFDEFIASNNLADHILDLLADPSNLELTFAQFSDFCKKQRQTPQTPTPAETLASMEADLADLIAEEEEKTKKKATKKRGTGATSTTSASLSPINVVVVSPSPSPNLPPSPAMRGSASNLLALNRSFGSRPSLDRLSPSLSPLSSLSKKNSHIDPDFDSRPGVKKVPFRDLRRPLPKQRYENFLDKILQNPTLPVSANDHVARWNHTQTLDTVRSFSDLSSKGGQRYAQMSDHQIKEQILRHDATSIDSLLQSELFRNHYTKCVSDRYFLFKVSLDLSGKSATQEWTIATAAVTQKQELVHFFCHDIAELKPSESNAKKSLISTLLPAIEGIDLRATGTVVAQSELSPLKRSKTVDVISAVPQENSPPLLKVLRQHPLTGPSILWIAPTLS